MLGSVALGVLSVGLGAVALFESAHYQDLLASFLEITETSENTHVTAEGFRLRMLSLAGSGILMALTTWYLFARAGAGGPAPADVAEGLRGALLFLLCGLALLSYVWGCFLGWESWLAACRLYAKEGPVDTFHALAYLASALVLGHAALGKPRWPNGARGTRAIVGLAAAVLLFAALEEISWGQTLFAWSSPQSVAGWNFQGETNLHNAFNPAFTRAYLIGSLIAYAGVSAGVLIGQRLPEHAASGALPATAMYWGALWLPAAGQVGVYTNTEPFESVVAVLALYYAFCVAAQRRRQRR